MERLIDTNLLDGWVPLRLYWSEGQPQVDWCHLGRHTFSDPFFDQTISKRIDLPFNLLFRHQTSIDVLRQRYETNPGLAPTGFIFHMSRSGSTLVSRMLASLPQNIVISEPPPIDGILRAHHRPEPVPEQQLVLWLRWMVSALAQERLGGERRIFIKFDAWNILELPLIRLAFPDVPWIFIYRDPIAVLVSQMEHLGQMIPSAVHYGLFGNDAGAVVNLPPEQYYAVLLATLCHAALLHREQGGLLVNYSQLPDTVGSSISEFFGIGWTDAEAEIMTSKTKHHSKDPSGIFQDDSARKQAQASEEVVEAATRWLYPIYEKLESSRLGGPG